MRLLLRLRSINEHDKEGFGLKTFLQVEGVHLEVALLALTELKHSI